MKLDFLRERYKINSTNDATVEAMLFLVDSIEKNFSDFDSAWINSLDLLQINYDLLYAAKDDIDKNGKQCKDYRDRLVRNPSISILLNAQNNIMNILSRMGLNVLSKVRVKQLMKEESEKDSFSELFED